MVVVLIKIKFRISKYFQVFNEVIPGYEGLANSIFLGNITFVLMMLNFIQLAVHHPCTALMSDCSRLLSTDRPSRV
jgi:hypothetical protein